MSGEHGLEQVPSLLEFFREEMTCAFERMGVQTSEETEAYLVHLLDGYTRLDPESAEEVGFEKPAAMLLEEAMSSAGDRRIEIYRRLGDASLYNCGFFGAHITRRSVSPDYYRKMGRIAYQNLGDMMGFKQPGGIFHAIFSELASKFDGIVDAFRLISGTSNPGDESLRKLEAMMAKGLYAVPIKSD